MIRPVLVVMAKTPRLGGGKSRLAHDLGAAQAWRINRFLQARTLQAVGGGRWETVLAAAPDRDVRARLPGVWDGAACGHVRRIGQGGGDLGDRLARRFRAQARGPLAVIGADCPDLTRRHISAAFAALRRAPYAVGPTFDGGFWILAARVPRRAAQAFAHVAWSTPTACADLLAALDGPAVLLEKLADIDTGADWRGWVQRSRR